MGQNSNPPNGIIPNMENSTPPNGILPNKSSVDNSTLPDGTIQSKQSSLESVSSGSTDSETSYIPPHLVHRISILIVGFFIIMTSAGITHNFGVLIPTIMDEFNVTTTEVSWAIGIEQFFCYITGVLALPVVDMLGWRLAALIGTMLGAAGLLLTSVLSEFYAIYLTYGIFTGIGLGTLFLLAFLVAGNFWENRMQMAFTVVTLGFETGLMLLGPLIQVLTDSIGWRSTERVLAVMTLAVGLCAVLVYKPLPVRPIEPEIVIECNGFNKESSFKTDTENDPLLESSSESSQWEAFKARFIETWKFYIRLDFLLLGIGFFGFTWSYDSPYIFLPMRAQTLGIEALKSTTLLTIFGLSGIVVRVILLFIPFGSFKLTVASTGCCLFFAAVISLFMPLFTNYTSLAVYSALLGSTLAYVFSSYIYIVAGVVGMTSKDEAIAGTTAFCAFADLINSPCGGALLEATGDENAPFLLTGAVGVLCSIVYAATIYWKRDVVRVFHDEEKIKQRESATEMKPIH